MRGMFGWPWIMIAPPGRWPWLRARAHVLLVRIVDLDRQEVFAVRVAPGEPVACPRACGSRLRTACALRAAGRARPCTSAALRRYAAAGACVRPCCTTHAIGQRQRGLDARRERARKTATGPRRGRAVEPAISAGERAQAWTRVRTHGTVIACLCSALRRCSERLVLRVSRRDLRHRRQLIHRLKCDLRCIPASPGPVSATSL